MGVQMYEKTVFRQNSVFKKAVLRSHTGVYRCFSRGFLHYTDSLLYFCSPFRLQQAAGNGTVPFDMGKEIE